MYTQFESASQIEIPSHFKLPIVVTTRPKRYQRSLPEIPLLNQGSRNQSPLEIQRCQKRSKLQFLFNILIIFLKQQNSKILAPVTQFQRKKWNLREIETGNQNKQDITETQKPLRRIAHQKNKSFQI